MSQAKVLTCAALLAFAAAGPVLAQGASGKVSGSFQTETGSGIAPADGSNMLNKPMHSKADLDAMARSGVWVPGATYVMADSSTTTMGNTTTTTTRYWVNVPADVRNDRDFRRWSMLK